MFLGLDSAKDDRQSGECITATSSSERGRGLLSRASCRVTKNSSMAYVLAYTALGSTLAAICQWLCTASIVFCKALPTILAGLI